MTDASRMPPREEIRQRIRATSDALVGALRQSDGSEQWAYQTVERVDAVREMAMEHVQFMEDEHGQVQRGVELHKDSPDVSTKRVMGNRDILPDRLRGFIDRAHEIEYRITEELKALQKEIDKELPKNKRAGVLTAFRAFAETMDDAGICMGQTKEFAGKSSMPSELEPGFGDVSSRGVFKKLIDPDARSKSKSDPKNR